MKRRTGNIVADWCNGSTADSDSVSRGSSPLSVAFGVWLSLVERYVRDVEAAGSNPVTPITGKKEFSRQFADMRNERSHNRNSNADWCNGSTADSDSVSRGSSPLSVAFGVWLSLVERYVRDVEAAGSNPVTPIGAYKYRNSCNGGSGFFVYV